MLRRVTVAAAAAAVLLSAAGCSDEEQRTTYSYDDDEDERRDDLGEALGVDVSTIQGTLYVDDFTSVVQGRRRGEVVQCTAPDLAGGLGQDAEVILITDPDGTQVALGRLGVGRPDTVRDRGREVAVPGTCTFNWTAKIDEELGAGVYTAAVLELGIATRFTQEDAAQIALEYDR